MISNYSYQMEANILCLLEDTEYAERKETFLEIVKEFEEKKIRWGLACSMNLFLRGVVDEFHDIDVIAEIEDSQKIRDIIESKGGKLIATGGNGSCESDMYMHYQLGRVDLDVICGFRVVTFGTRYLYRFTEREVDRLCMDTTREVPLISMEAMYILYSMMEGWQKKRRYKRILIEEFLLTKGLKYPEIFQNALKKYSLPNWIQRNIREIISSNF